MSLDNIQLDIVVTLQGSQAIRNATTGLQGLSRAADMVRERSHAMVPINLSQINSWDSMTEALGEVERKYDAVFRAGAHMSMMGQSLIDSSRRIAEAAFGIVDAYEGYDLMLRRGATALNVNEEWQGRLDEAIQTTARTIGLLKPEEVAEGYYIWGAAAGMVVDTQEELNQISAVVADTMVATAMAGGTLEGNLNGVFGVLSQFNLPMSQASDVVKTLGLMTERTAAQFPDLINSLSYIGPLAESLGITFEDVTSILGLLADAGQKGSRAGRGLSMVIEGMSAPSGPAGEALDGLIQRTHGLTAAWEDVIFPKGEFVGMRDMLIEMALAAEDMTDAERGRFYATAFTNNATRALIPLIEDQIDLNREAAESGREITSVLDQQKYATEGAGHFFEVMKEQALGSITAIKGRLTNSFFPVIQQIATEIMTMALPVMEYLGDIAVKFGDWLKANPELVQMAIRIAGITAAAMAGAGVLFSLGGAIMYLIGNLGVFIQGIGRILGPFGLLIGLFVGLGVAVANNVGGIRDAFGRFWNEAANLFNKITDNGSTFRVFWEGLWEALRSASEWVITQLAELLNDLADAMRWLSNQEGFVSFMQGALTVLLQFRGVIATLAVVSATMWAAGRALAFFTGALKILTGYSAIVGVIRGIATAFGVLSAVFAAFQAGGVMAGLGSIVALLGGPVTLVIAGVVAAVAGLWLAWENNFLGIRDIVANVVTWLTEVAFPAIGEFFTNLVTTVGGAIGAVVDFFANLPARIGEFLTMVWEGITGWITSIVTAIGDFISTLLTNIGNFLADLADNWDYYLGYVLGFIIGWIARVIFEVGKFLVTLIGNIVEWISKAPGRFAEWLGKTWATVSTWFTQTLIPNVWNFMSTLIANIVTWISQAPGKFMTWLGEVWNSVSAWFTGFIEDAGVWAEETINAIIDWFKKLPGRVIKGIGTLVSKMRDFLEDLPGKIWDAIVGIGKAIVEGVWQGIQDAWQQFWDSVHDFFSGIVDGVKDALDIHSPSRVFAEIGRYMVEGMAVGITTNDSAMRAMQSYANSLVGVADGTSIGFSIGSDLADSAAGLSVTADGQRVIRIEMDLTSSDGSYDDATLEQLKAALTGSDLVRALERMAEAD